jgi:hypothetical protein
VYIWPWETDKNALVDYWNFLVGLHNSMVLAFDIWVSKTAVTYDDAVTSSAAFVSATNAYIAVLDNKTAELRIRGGVPSAAVAFKEAALEAWTTERAAAARFRDGAANADVSAWNEAVDLADLAANQQLMFEARSLEVCDRLGG